MIQIVNWNMVIIEVQNIQSMYGMSLTLATLDSNGDDDES